MAATVGSYQVQSNSKTPVPDAAPDLDTINLIDYDFAKYGDPAERDRLVSRWTNEIFPQPR